MCWYEDILYMVCCHYLRATTQCSHQSDRYRGEETWLSECPAMRLRPTKSRKRCRKCDQRLEVEVDHDALERQQVEEEFRVTARNIAQSFMQRQAAENGEPYVGIPTTTLRSADRSSKNITSPSHRPQFLSSSLEPLAGYRYTNTRHTCSRTY